MISSSHLLPKLIILTILAWAAAGCAHPTSASNTVTPAGPSPTTIQGTPTLQEARPAQPTATPTPPPTPTSMAKADPTPRPLTTVGCCPDPFWSPDSRMVLFIDKPTEESPSGIWGVDIAPGHQVPRLITRRVAHYTPDLIFLVELGDDSTTLERLPQPVHLAQGEVEGTKWTVPARGQPVALSPGRERIAWATADEGLPIEERVTQLWVADLDGENPVRLAPVPRGGIVAWVSDDVLLVTGRESLHAQEQVYYTLSLLDGKTVELVRGERIRGALLSPERTWLAYFVAMDEDPTQNDLWLVRTDGTDRRRLDRDLFGAYQWRDGHRLLIVPLRPDAEWHELWQYDVQTSEAKRLTDPAQLPFKIASGYWVVSPDGKHVAFVGANDRNLWLLTLPD